ncbi:MAG: hypothetical protein D6705_02420 [Deltaproteobacteria bacterium]|nr:MAG: hypothetical protein D6705_02420 [Deltaproteobacteria bacterium]
MVPAALGFGVAAAAVIALHHRIEPLKWLRARFLIAYVSAGCADTRGLVEQAKRRGFAGELIWIPVTVEPSAEDLSMCTAALARIRKAEGPPWWATLPDGYLCTRMFAESYRHVTERHDGRVPVVDRPGEAGDLIAGARGAEDAVDHLEKFAARWSNGADP